MNSFYRKYILFLISVPLLIAGNSNVSNMKKMAVDKVEDQAKLIQEMVDKIYSNFHDLSQRMSGRLCHIRILNKQL